MNLSKRNKIKKTVLIFSRNILKRGLCKKNSF